MADINNISRKRKSSDFYNNFGVDDLECSPSNSPEPEALNKKCLLKEPELIQTSTDMNVNKITMNQEELSISLGVPSIPKTDDLDMEVDKSSQDTNDPFISVIFHDNEFANIYKSQIVSYIKSLVSFDLIEECKRESDTIVNLWEYPKQQQEKENNTELFSVDTTPSKGREIIQLPKYMTNDSSLIEEFDANKPNGDTEINVASTLVCFNCDGSHAIRDCKEIRDHRRISMARNKYMANAPAKTTRYHLDDEQKFKHLVPGKVSEKLKKALNVRKHEVPSYIYRMRMFGYPPGWLEEAKVTNSSLELFDFQGCSVEESCNDKKVIDANKIIEYPGFNVPLEKGDIDDYKYYRCPAYCEQFSKKTMLEYIENYAESQKPKKTDTTETLSSKFESDSNSQESEIQTPRSVSPTLNDLELRKRQLLAELEDGCTSSPLSIVPTETPEKEKNEEIKEPEIIKSIIKEDEVVVIKEDEVAVIKENEVIIAEVTETKIVDIVITEDVAADTTVLESPNVVSSTFGTPILKTASPFLQLPDRDKWSKDISQVINFENLPNATGKYEQMTKVISKVRSIVKGEVSADAEEKNKS